MKNSYYLSNGVFLLALITLLFNDLYLKTNFHNALTGKLSDLSGLIVFVLFLSFLFGDRFKTILFISTAILFCWWKSSLSTGFITNWNGLFPFYSIERIVDYTDLICLLVLIPVYFYQPKAKSQTSQRVGIPLLLVSMFAIAATSKGGKGNIGAYSDSYTYIIDKSFKLDMTRSDFFKNIAFSNISFEKDPNVKASEKASDPQSYILKNFTIHDGLVIEVMYISIKEKKRYIVIDLHKMVIQDSQEGTSREIKKRITKETQEYFSDNI